MSSKVATKVLISSFQIQETMVASIACLSMTISLIEFNEHVMEFEVGSNVDADFLNLGEKRAGKIHVFTHTFQDESMSCSLTPTAAISDSHHRSEEANTVFCSGRHQR